MVWVVNATLRLFYFRYRSSAPFILEAGWAAVTICTPVDWWKSLSPSRFEPRAVQLSESVDWQRSRGLFWELWEL